MRWTPDHDSMLFLGVNLLSREGNSQTGFRKVIHMSGCSSRLVNPLVVRHFPHERTVSSSLSWVLEWVWKVREENQLLPMEKLLK